MFIKIHDPLPLDPHLFLHGTNTSGVEKVKLLFTLRGSQAITLSVFFGYSLFNIANQIILKRISFFGALPLSRVKITI